jgi:chromate transporter
MHIPQFKRRLVDRHRFFTLDTLTEVNAFCSILPGPSTTQTITILGWKQGGPMMAFLSLLAWALPGASIMTIIALSPTFLGANHLLFMQPMVAAFLAFSVFTMVKWIKKSTLNYSIFVGIGMIGFLLNSPIVFPLGVLIAGLISAKFNRYELPELPKKEPEPIVWKNLTAIGIIFIIVGGIGFILGRNEEFLQLSHPIVLFENTYRIGALSFGGGTTLAAMSHEQYVVYHHRLTPAEFNNGLGLLQAMPGPNFNFMVYVNAMAMKFYGYNVFYQFLGCLIGLIAVFLPGTLLVFFAYPIWDRLQSNRNLRFALDGIFAAAVGFILTAALVINSFFWHHLNLKYTNSLLEISAFTATLLLLSVKKIPTPFIVILMLLAGWLLPV